MSITRVLTLDKNRNSVLIPLSDLIKNSQIIHNFTQKIYYLDSGNAKQKIFDIENSENLFYLNGVLLAKDFDYKILNETKIELFKTTKHNSVLHEVKGSFIQQGGLSFSYHTITEQEFQTKEINVQDSSRIFNIDSKILLPSEYIILSKNKILLKDNINLNQNSLIGELKGGGFVEKGETGEKGDTGQNGLNGVSFNFRDEYNNTNTYNSNDVVTFLGSSFIAKKDNIKSIPSSLSQDWSLLCKGQISVFTGIELIQPSVDILGSKFYLFDTNGVFIKKYECIPLKMDLSEIVWEEI